ncbi:MAG TPA: hypothetical protein VFA11_10460 [Acidimicrobiales bacterium]|nr:hypothetical protein [Acidimicrobiales bacterium]
MSRATRRYRKWERAARQGAYEDARQLALDMYEGRPGPVNPYGMGVVLESSEVLYREVKWMRYATLGVTPDLVDGAGQIRPGSPRWRDWGWCDSLVTSHRLVTRLAGDGGRLVSNWWSWVAGVNVDLAADTVVLDDHSGEWRGAYTGPGAPVLAVAAIERVHGTAALVDHPALAPLRDLTRRVGNPRRPPGTGPFVLTGGNR